MSDEIYKTTKEHFEIFQKEVRRCLLVLNLLGWEVYFFHEHIYSQAEVYIDAPGRTATFTLIMEWERIEPTTTLIRKAAFHEVCELLLSKLSFLATTEIRRVLQTEVIEEVHNVIRILEIIVWEKWIVKLKR